VNLNHGSYGAPPLSVIEMQREWQTRVERNPDRFFRYDMYNELDRVRKQMAMYLGVHAEDLAFVENASEGMNTVLRSLFPTSSTRNKILFLNTAYQMVKNTIYYVSDTPSFGDSYIQINITFPTTSDAIVDLLVGALEQNAESVFLASFSHITSIPGMILPVERMIEECHKRNVMVVIDGAHVMGQIPLNVTQLNADFYVSNGHKWLYSPKGSAVLWARKDRQSLIVPTVISDEGQGRTLFQLEFSYVGTKDYTPYLSMSSALDFRSSLGDRAIMDYIHNLAVNGGDVLASRWNTGVLVENDMVPAMVNVRLPTNAPTPPTPVPPNQVNPALIPQLLLEKFDTWVPTYALQGQWWVRVSAQIYNDISDFEFLASAILSLLNNTSSSESSFVQNLPL